MEIQKESSSKLKKYEDTYWKQNVPAMELRRTLNILLSNINNSQITKNSLYKKIRILEEGKSIETFTILNMRLYENRPEEGYIQFKRLSKKATKHVHFKSKCDIIITQLPKKKKKITAIIIDVHGPVYYPDWTRRYDENEKDEKKQEINPKEVFGNINEFLKHYFRKKAKFELLICDFNDINKIYSILTARISDYNHFKIRSCNFTLKDFRVEDEMVLLLFIWRITINSETYYSYPLNFNPKNPFVLKNNQTLILNCYGNQIIDTEVIDVEQTINTI